MFAVVQRVTEASVTVGNQVTGSIGNGLLVLLGVEIGDTESHAAYLSNKIVELRIFQDENAKMNRSLTETGGAMLVVSQFTLLADCRKGRRPSFNAAAPPDEGNRLYELFVDYVRKTGVRVETGIFGAMMQVSLVNDGPVTVMVESRKWSGDRLPLPGLT